MTGSALISSGGVATLTVPSSLPKTDPLLCVIASILNPTQLEVEVIKPKGKKKGNNSNNASVQLEIQEKSQTILHRNAILRSITGVDLHSILDRGSIIGCYLQGGHSAAASYGSRNVTSTSVLASISSWMSVASTVVSLENLKQVLEYLDSTVLGQQSFLVQGCGCPTLADFDLYFAIRLFLSKHFSLQKDEGETWSDWIVGANVQRWWDVLQSSVAQMVQMDQRSSILLKDMDASLLHRIEFANTAPQLSPPVFYYGEEGEVLPDAPSVPVSATITAKTTASTPSPTNGPPKTSVPGELTEEHKKAAAEKRAKKKAAKAAKAKAQPKAKHGAPAAELDISALDIRVGKILKAWNHETAEKLYCEEVDLGEASGPRKIASGLRPFYSLEEMQQDRFVLVLSNLKARNLVGFPSHGMVMCASNDDHTKVEFVTAPEGAKIGDRVIFEGSDAEPEAENKMAKKKIFEKLAPDLKTDGEGGIVWKGKKAMVAGMQCFAINRMKNAHVA